MKYSYEVQVLRGDRWCTLFRDHGLSFCHGFVSGFCEYAFPRLAMRILRSDGKTVRSEAARDDVSVGMIAGSPSADQYRRAAARAIERAERIEKAEAMR